MKKIKESDKDLSASMEAILTVGVDTVNNSTLYTTKAFKGGLGARNVLQYSMSDLATADRAVVGRADGRRRNTGSSDGGFPD